MVENTRGCQIKVKLITRSLAGMDRPSVLLIMSSPRFKMDIKPL